jgi:hypothetical protein
MDAVSPLFKFECLATSINSELSFFKMPMQVDDLRKTFRFTSRQDVYKIEELNISDLPSFARVCLNVIVLEENNLKNGKLRSGYLLGSVSFSIFDQDHVVRAGSQNLSLWPFQAFNPRLICQGQHYTRSKEEEPFSALMLSITHSQTGFPVEVYGGSEAEGRGNEY